MSAVTILEPTTQKLSIPYISQLYNFHYHPDGLRVWRAFDIGEGIIFGLGLYFMKWGLFLYFSYFCRWVFIITVSLSTHNLFFKIIIWKVQGEPE